MTMYAYIPIMIVLAISLAMIGLLYLASLAFNSKHRPESQPVYLCGHEPREHAMSRYHVRWYLVALLFLAFDMEMVFMYPWAVVFAEVGMKAMIEMGMFLMILLLGVLYAWREGAFRWR